MSSMSKMMLISVASLMTMMSHTSQATGALDCFNHVSGWSGKGDDNYIEIGCPNAYTLTDCMSITNWNKRDGEKIVNGKCRAYNGGGGNGVKAVARCCRMPSSCSYRDILSHKSGTGDDSKSLALCDTDEVATGCQAYSPWKNLDGSFPDYNDNGDVTECWAQNGNGGNGIYAGARCFQCGSDGKNNPDCTIRKGSRSSTSDDATSVITCVGDETLVGCSAQSNWENIDGAQMKEVSGVDFCIAQNGSGGNGVTAYATCCEF